MTERLQRYILLPGIYETQATRCGKPQQSPVIHAEIMDAILARVRKEETLHIQRDIALISGQHHATIRSRANGSQPYSAHLILGNAVNIIDGYFISLSLLQTELTIHIESTTPGSLPEMSLAVFKRCIDAVWNIRRRSYAQVGGQQRILSLVLADQMRYSMGIIEYSYHGIVVTAHLQGGRGIEIIHEGIERL